jgi:antitoxin (DNA-binding transcriptional repressor) of toxin-antitoxin stability system
MGSSRKHPLLTCVTLCGTLYFMPSVNIRQLRDTRRLESWLRAGKTVELRKRDRVIARIVPENWVEAHGAWPDFDAIAKEIFGDRILTNAVLEDRGRF